MAMIHDLSRIRAGKEMVQSVGACERAYRIPQCTIVREFLAREGLPWQAFYMPLAMTREQRHTLGAALEALHKKVTEEQARLCATFDVERPDQLSRAQRRFFDATLRAFIEREDHLPSS